MLILKTDNLTNFFQKLALRTLKIYWAGIALLLLSACAGMSLGGAPPTIKIGLVSPFEGLHRPLGYQALFAVKLALQERNAAGGINGHQIELVALNDFDDPAEAQVQARVLAADPDVLGVVGHFSAATTRAAMPVYQGASLAMSIPWTAHPIDAQAGVVSVAANSVETAKRLETLALAQGYSEIVTVSNRLSRPISADTQAIALDTEGVAAGELIVQMRESNIDLPQLGHVNVGSPQMVQVAGAVAAGLQYVSPGPDPAATSKATAFAEAYQALAGFPPGPRAVLAYDATNILLDAIEQAFYEQGHQPDRADVSAKIVDIERQGLSGNISFNARGQRVNAPIWIYQISEEGRYPGTLVVAPEE